MLYSKTSVAMLTEWTLQKLVTYMYVTPAPNESVLKVGRKNAATAMSNAVTARC